MPQDHGTTPNSDAGPSAIAVAALGAAAAIVSWTESSERPARRGFRLLLDGQSVPPPATHCSVAQGDLRRHLLAVPARVARLTQARLQVTALDGTVVAHGDRSGLQAPRVADLDPLSLVPELEPRESIRLIRFLLEIAPSLFRLGRDDSFVAFARALVEVLAGAPDPLAARCCAGPLAVFETAAHRGIGERLTAVLVGRNAVTRILTAPAVLPHPKPQRGLARIAVAVERAQLAPESCLVVLGEGGVACRRLPATEPASSAFELAHRDGALDLALRNYIVDALVAIDDAAVPTAALIRELRAATVDLRTAAPSGAVSGGVELVLPTAAGTLVLGWLADPHRVAEAVTVRRRERDTHVPIARLRRFRHPLRDRDASGASGFILAAPPVGETSLLASIQLRLQLGSGESLVLGDGPSQTDLDAALGSALDALSAGPDAEVAPQSEIRAILQALARGPAEPPSFQIEEIGRRAADPRIAVVVPVTADLELIRCRFAALALEPRLAAQAEIVHVVEDPARASATAATLRRTAQIYGHGTRLLVAGQRCRNAAAVNAAMSATTAPVVVVLGPQAMPSAVDWISRLLRELDANPRAGIVAARRIAGDGSLVDLGFDRETDADGRTRFVPRLAGFPIDHRDAAGTTKVAGSTRGAWILRRSLFELVGGLASDLVSDLGTDLDFCCRVRAAGFELRQLAEVDMIEMEDGASCTRAGIALRIDQECLLERWPFRPVESGSTPLPETAPAGEIAAPTDAALPIAESEPDMQAEAVASDPPRKGAGAKRRARKSRRAA